MSVNQVNIDLLKRTYFYFDKPVPYTIKDKTIFIKPVSVENSEIFLSSFDILSIDKNSLPDPKIIQMSYLQFLVEYLLKEEENVYRIVNILNLCLGFEKPRIATDELGKYIISDDIFKVEINAKDFDNIRRIILYQNLIDYDDEYINPDLKKALDEANQLKMKNVEIPDLERQMAIITAHCGLPKYEQLKMTYRSFKLLFKEIHGEVEYTTLFPVLCQTKNNTMEPWIFKKKKGKFDDGVISVSDFNKSSGGNGEIQSLELNSQNMDIPYIQKNN